MRAVQWTRPAGAKARGLRLGLELCLGLMLGAALGAASASAQGVPLRRVGANWRGGVPYVDVSIRDVASGDATRRKLMSGLPQLLTLRVVAYAEGDKPKSVSATARSCRVVYDLWEEAFRVVVNTPGGETAFQSRSVDDVLERCLVLRRAPVGDAGDFGKLRGKGVSFAVLAELNPLSQETVQKIRGWLARPAGDRVEGEAFFGSFVSLFVSHRVGQAERIVRFRSQVVRVP